MTTNLKCLLLGATVSVTSVFFGLFQPDLSLASSGLITATPSEALQNPLQIAQVKNDRVIFINAAGNEVKGIILEASGDRSYFTIKDMHGVIYYRVSLANIVGTW